MGDIKVLQELFYKYIATTDEKHDNIIALCKEQFPNLEKTIDRIRKVLDSLNNESKSTFVTNVFDINNQLVSMEYIEQMESLIDNKTSIINVQKPKAVDLLSFDNFEKQELVISVDKLMESRKLTPIDETDTRFYNNVVERLLGFDYDKLGICKDEDRTYLTSIYDLPEISDSKIDKEGSTVDTHEIEYLFDRMIGEKPDKQKYLNRILVDLITNQNYRILANGFGTLNSDNFDNDYYVLDGVTIKKEYAFESLYINYSDEVKTITNLITDNYDKILTSLENIINSDKVENKSYFENLKNNIVRLHEKFRVTKRLNEIENGTEVDVFDKNRTSRNEILSRRLDSINNSLNLGGPKKALVNENVSKAGYASIFTLVAGVILFGVMFAYLVLSR